MRVLFVCTKRTDLFLAGADFVLSERYSGKSPQIRCVPHFVGTVFFIAFRLFYPPVLPGVKKPWK